MKHDLDRLMAERNLDAIVVEGPDGLESANPDYNYFVGGRHIPGLIIKKRGEPTMLLHSPWEQNEAEQTGLALVSLNRWNLREILQEFPDRLEARVEHRRRIFTDLGVRGRVGIYGTVKAGPFFALMARLAQQIDGLEIVAELDRDVISMARLTKDADEVERMRAVGRKTCAVLQVAVDFICTGWIDGGSVRGVDGAPLTIGDVRRVMLREIAAQGLETPAGMIISQGRDAGLPHARGDDAMPLRPGQAIVIDIFPREAGGGYFHDMTRTFAIGYAPPELQQAYNDVLGAFEMVTAAFEAGAPTRKYQDMVCDYFEARGHDTIRRTYPIEEGYIHSLGHGLGLEVHEDLSFSSLVDRGDTIEPGAVFTVEPGLYYPSRGFGVRIEDTYYCAPDGHFESLTPFPKELVIRPYERD
ncbi:M24 family metallopeptidase [Roseiflexus castenholzii]|uniref:M24 family metallopeptidase n=1 Tax=Roseiflexus castenholzii TaxID=120962 RepID=UPI000314C297|nr:Xaa-Pro peptidase family protein [Roseiflexus castenholzii]